MEKNMNRIDVVRMLIEKRKYSRYLEIGCQTDVCFQSAKKALGPHGDAAIGVDPVAGGTHRTTSDIFFTQARAHNMRFDLIFIDGDHRHPQVQKDVDNALSMLEPHGCLVMHDCLPPNASYEGSDLCGTAWRVYAKLRTRTDLDAVVGDFDHGVGVIRFGNNPQPVVITKSLDQLTYDDFVANRTQWMRPVTAEYIEALASMSWGGSP